MEDDDDYEYKAMRQAVLDDPEDDSPRLIMADWWDDRGESERANFIRHSIALYRNTFNCHCDWCEYTHKHDKADHYLLPSISGMSENGQANADLLAIRCRGVGKRCRTARLSLYRLFYGSLEWAKWLDWVHRLKGIRSSDPPSMFRRGFLYKVFVYSDTWIKCGSEIAKENPIEKVVIASDSPCIYPLSVYTTTWPKINFTLPRRFVGVDPAAPGTDQTAVQTSLAGDEQTA